MIYRGRVQGVGFRWRTTRALDGMPITGFVRNLPDGTVELVVEGAPSAVSAALEAVATALARQIESCDAQSLAATGEFSDFRILR